MTRWFALDTGSAKNACALAGFARDKSGAYYPVALREWLPAPGVPLDLRLIELPQAAKIAKGLGGQAWASDAYAISDVKIVAAEHGLQTVVPPTDSWELWRHIWVAHNRGRLALAPTGRPGMPGAEALSALRSQLATAQRRPGAQGKWVVTLPEVEGLHGDMAVAAARALWLARAADADFAASVKRRSGSSVYAGEIAPLTEL